MILVEVLLRRGLMLWRLFHVLQNLLPGVQKGRSSIETIRLRFSDPFDPIQTILDVSGWGDVTEVNVCVSTEVDIVFVCDTKHELTADAFHGRVSPVSPPARRIGSGHHFAVYHVCADVIDEWRRVECLSKWSVAFY
jgi:hypothetical protein